MDAPSCEVEICGIRSPLVNKMWISFRLEEGGISCKGLNQGRTTVRVGHVSGCFFQESSAETTNGPVVIVTSTHCG